MSNLTETLLNLGSPLSSYLEYHTKMAKTLSDEAQREKEMALAKLEQTLREKQEERHAAEQEREKAKAASNQLLNAAQAYEGKLEEYGYMGEIAPGAGPQKPFVADINAMQARWKSTAPLYNLDPNAPPPLPPEQAMEAVRRGQLKRQRDDEKKKVQYQFKETERGGYGRWNPDTGTFEELHAPRPVDNGEGGGKPIKLLTTENILPTYQLLSSMMTSKGEPPPTLAEFTKDEATMNGYLNRYPVAGMAKPLNDGQNKVKQFGRKLSQATAEIQKGLKDGTMKAEDIPREYKPYFDVVTMPKTDSAWDSLMNTIGIPNKQDKIVPKSEDEILEQMRADDILTDNEKLALDKYIQFKGGGNTPKQEPSEETKARLFKESQKGVATQKSGVAEGITSEPSGAVNIARVNDFLAYRIKTFGYANGKTVTKEEVQALARKGFNKQEAALILQKLGYTVE